MDDEYKDAQEEQEFDHESRLNDESEDRGEMQVAMHLSGMYEDWFLDYASYVILERAVPEIHDGLKPVHRRIMHSMREMDDGRYNKVANIIGNTMKYHPHGDASIGDALVHIGQKDLLVDTQGNWGNILTGDRAAASRYIEARLTKFALAVVFNPKTTTWKLSYDGRNQEPITLPVKFPLLLAQGVEGIAVGLASKILPHNFIELIDASIAVLRNKSFALYPDFLTGGLMDVERYKDGIRGGKLRVRARIVQETPKLLKIIEIPFSRTTTNLIDSILSANDKGKIKIKKIDDNTSENVEILLHLSPGVSPDQTIDALYAFTDCEVSISPNSCIIHEDKPVFLGMQEILRFSTKQTVDLLKMELEIRKGELLEQLHSLSLEKIFIENRIYRDIEKCESFEEVIVAIREGLAPFVKDFIREVTRDDIIRLTEIRIKRISKYNGFKADEQIKGLHGELEQVEYHLANLIDFAIDYFKDIKKRFGKGRGRKTEIRNFESIIAATVAVANQKLYVNRSDGFVGISLKKDEYVGLCSDIDDVIVFMADGSFMVSKVSSKTFVGKNIIHVQVFNKNDDRTTYNMVYRDGRQGNYYVKRFPVTSITRDKLYSLTKGTQDSKILYFTANPNGEAELIRVNLRNDPKLKKTSFDFDFKELTIKGRSAAGNILTKRTIRKIVVKEGGVSTLGAIDIWYDETVKRLNTEERGLYLGAFKGEDRILTIMKTGHYQLLSFDVSNHFDDHMVHIEKYDHRKVISVVYTETVSKLPYVKRFKIDESDKKVCFVGDDHGKLLEYSLDYLPQLIVKYRSVKDRKNLSQLLNLDNFIGIKSLKAKGKRLTAEKVKSMEWAEPLAYEYPPLEGEENEIVHEAAAEPKEGKGAVKAEEVTEKEVKETQVVEVSPKEEASPKAEKNLKKKVEKTPEKNLEKVSEKRLPKKKEQIKKVLPEKEKKTAIPKLKKEKVSPKEEASAKEIEEVEPIEFEIEIDENHILIDNEYKKNVDKNDDKEDEGQITLDFE
ncbi:MAG: DNA gyrase/topoisomerase IV subunit A [Bacteroidales bacterium]|nr:DNA gyrase/topoisomerase IV subunit A [Bacteroidales bacterium]